MLLVHSEIMLSVMIPVKMQEQLEKLSDVRGKTISFLAAEAIGNYLSVQSQISALDNALEKESVEHINFIGEKDLLDWLNNLASYNEKEMLKGKA